MQSHRQPDRVVTFSDRILRISPQLSSATGAGLLGVGGAAAAVTGSFSAASGTLQKLQRATVNFVRLYRDADTSHAAMGDAADAIESELRALETFSVLSPADTQTLINELHAIVKEKP